MRCKACKQSMRVSTRAQVHVIIPVLLALASIACGWFLLQRGVEPLVAGVVTTVLVVVGVGVAVVWFLLNKDA